MTTETYAICKADMLLKGDGDQADHIAYGSTLSADGNATRQFDFMLANPPYGKSWKTDAEKMGGKKDILDSRFNAYLEDGTQLSMIPRTSDGQLLFLLNNVAKMKKDTPLGSRIAEVHNGSSIFTGDAGSGESNARRYLIENDLVEAIIALPENMFYNTGIGTFIWVLSRAIDYHKQHPENFRVSAYQPPTIYNDNSKEHRNVVFADTLEAIENIVLFSISNYFLRFSNEYKKIHGVDEFDNNWYEYVEFGTTNILARITGFIEEQTGVASNYCNYMNTQTKNPFEIEHIITDHYEWFTAEYSDQDDFKRWRNSIGALLLLHKSINASLNDAKYDYKLSKYCSNEGNIYTESLGNSAYQNNPKFKKFIADYQLGFKAYAQFGKAEIMERTSVLIQLVQLIWNDEMFK